MRRDTRQREAVLLAVKGSSSHPTADQIYEKVRKQIPNISKGTVYRNLRVLQETGQITELNLNGVVTRYEARKEEHYHFRCDRCGQVFDLNEPINIEMNKRVSERTGLKIFYHQLEFSGLCQECNTKAED